MESPRCVSSRVRPIARAKAISTKVWLVKDAVDQTWIGDDGLDATLSAGKKVKGALYYEIPAEAAEITLEYDVNFYSSDKIIFIVK